MMIIFSESYHRNMIKNIFLTRWKVPPAVSRPKQEKRVFLIVEAGYEIQIKYRLKHIIRRYYAKVTAFAPHVSDCAMAELGQWRDQCGWHVFTSRTRSRDVPYNYDARFFIRVPCDASIIKWFWSFTTMSFDQQACLPLGQISK